MSGNGSGQSRKKSPVGSELTKQIGVVCIVAAIGVWQYKFVLQAATADIYIFGLLISAGLFGIYNAIRGTYALGNDFVALEAMKEIHQDAQRRRIAPEDHDRIVEQRMAQDQVVYNLPTSIGTAHNLIVEEILRSGSLRIPTTTMQVLVSDLEGKLDERQGTSHYLGALMVLLGLLGTFIGLMHTLESVGGILGSLDLSGNGGTGAIASLIESLKRPLEGMSTGFGASLFGLIGSLIIGVLAKFDTKASHRLRHDFETWIRSAVQIEGAGSASTMPATPALAAAAVTARPNSALDEGNWRMMFQAARQTVLATSKIAGQVAALAETVDALVAETREQNDRNSKMFEKIAWNMGEDAAAQAALSGRMDRLSEQLRAVRDELQARLAAVDSAQEAGISLQVAQFDDLGNKLKKLGDNILWHQSALFDTTQRMESIDSRLNEVAARKESLGDAAKALGKVTERDTDNLLFTLNHMIAATKLSPEDLARLRRLSDIVERNQKEADERADGQQPSLKELIG